MKKKILRISIILLAVLLLASPVYAIDPPDDIAINATYAFQHCLEENDQLYIVDFTVDDSPAPTETINEAYLVRLLDTGDAEIRVIAPTYVAGFPDNSGYSRQITAIYFSASEAPTWNQAYTMEVTGNPTLSWTGSIPSVSSSIDSWSASASISQTQWELSIRVLTIASFLGVAWSEDLVEVTADGTRLTTAGQTYFTSAISNLQTMAPYAFSGSLTEPDRDDLREYDQSYADELSANVTGTMLDMTALGGVLGLSRDFTSSLLFGFGLIIFLAITTQLTRSMKPLVVLSLPAIAVTAYKGFIPLEIAILAGVVALFISGYVLFYQKSSA